MSIYIIEFSPDQHYLSTDSDQLIGFVEVLYKTKKGPLGFNVDQEGQKIFQALVKDTIWFKESDQTFHVLDTAYLSIHTLFHFNGLFFMPDEWIEAEMKKEESNRIVRKKNLLLQRYNKPALEEEYSIFIQLFDLESKQYDSRILSRVHNEKVELALGHWDSLGAHLIFHRASVFMQRLINICNQLEVAISYVQDEKEIPSW